MTIYLVQVFTIGFLGLLIHPNKSQRRKREFMFLVFLILTIISGIRAYSVGADTRNYVNMFNSTDYIGILNTRIEMGFMTYLKMLHGISDDPGIMLITSSIICVGAACLFTYQFSKNCVMSMMLYILMGSYFGQMNTMRQAIALSISEVAFMLVISNRGGVRRKIVSAILLLLATSMHTIAAVAFIPYALVVRSNENENTGVTVQKTLLRAFGFAVLGFAGYSIIMAIATRLFPAYAYYFSNSQWSDSNYNAALFNTLISVVFALAGACVFRNKELNNIQRFSAIMIGFSIIFNVLSMRMEIWNRLAGMFGIYTNLLWVSEFSSEIQNVKNRWILNSCIILFALAYMLIVLIFRPEWTQVVPYMVR